MLEERRVDQGDYRRLDPVFTLAFLFAPNSVPDIRGIQIRTEGADLNKRNLGGGGAAGMVETTTSEVSSWK